ncbi:MAG: hypothetical protein H3C51_11075 [Rubellimicrobium sp.]|nr:hypothetical protein [Rubellimicrobium sp.]
MGLTYKSMRTMLADRVRSGDLALWEPQFPGDSHKRTLFITAEVNDGFDEETWHDASLAYRYGQLAGDFDRYVTGDTIPVGFDPYDKSDNAFMARIDPAEYGIWDIRSMAPRPAIRVFGAFAEIDVFVALTTRLRRDLGSRASREWASAREDAIARWNNLFPGYPRLSGERIDDFISEKTLAV